MTPMATQIEEPKKTVRRRTTAKSADTTGAATDTPAIKECRFFSRDESWLKFNERVLEEAQDETNPLLERVKFLAITASNLDEFVEIRVAGILQRIEDGYAEPAPDGTTLEQSLATINAITHGFVAEQYLCWNQQLLPALRAAGVRVLL